MIELAWSAWSLIFLIASLFSMAAATIVYRSRPWDLLNRWVAILLAIEAAIFLVTGAHTIVQNAGWFRWGGTLITVGILWVSVSQLQVVSQLQSRLGSWLRRPMVLGVLLALAAAATAAMLVQSDLAIEGLVPSQAFAYRWQPGPLRELTLAFFLAVHFFALIVAVHAWRSARRGSRTRRRNGTFVVVFGFRDASLIVLVAIAPIAQNTLQAELAFFVMFAVANIIFLGLLSYAVLKDQFLDIDIRIKAGVRQSIVVGAFAAAFLVGSEVLEEFVPFNGVWVGVGAAGAISLVLRPLQAVATAAVERLMPDVAAGDEYLDARKVEVYQAALESAYADDRVTRKEERMLSILREKLGITEREASLLHQRINGETVMG